MRDPHATLVSLIRESRSILVFTGAGISTRSGIPDYRGPDGVWKTRAPVDFDAFVSSDDARRDYWELKLLSWIEHRNAPPNAVHEAIVRLERAGLVEAVVTQNVDGLHRRAGTSLDLLVEIHGTHFEIECLDCGIRLPPDEPYERFARERKPPLCGCGGLRKPATSSFGQALREADLDRAFDSASRADLVIALGSSLSVQPAASIPLVAVERGAA